MSHLTETVSRCRPGERVTVAVFAKPPVVGRVKTRLAARLGDRSATNLYRCFLDDLAALVGDLDESLPASIAPVLAVAGEADHSGFDAFRRTAFEFTGQGGGDLGARMARITRRGFAAGADKLLIIGADSPTLNTAHFRHAIVRLDDRDVVVGPSSDGGYYLIGLNGPHTAVFADIAWSSPRVLGQTMRRCRQGSLLCELLEFWYDVDTFEDLQLLRAHLFDYLRQRNPNVAPATAECMVRLADEGVFDRIDHTI